MLNILSPVSGKRRSLRKQGLAKGLCVKMHGALLVVLCAVAFPSLYAAAAGVRPPREALAILDAHASISPDAAALLDRFYVLRLGAPAWDKPARLAALIEQLEALGDDGLSPEDYGVSALRRHLEHAPADQDALGCVELLASSAYVSALWHLKFGRLDRATVEPRWQHQPPADASPVETALLVDAATAVDTPAAAFARARPQLPAYGALRAAHEALRTKDATAAAEAPTVPEGPLLRPGARTSRVALLRARLTAAGYAATHEDGQAEVFDDIVTGALLSFQQDHGLEADGIAGPATLAALNTSPAERLARLRANLERLRWLAADLRGLGDRHVLVDVGAASITYFRDGAAVWQARTQVGRPERPTPLLQSQITHFTFNPTWTIPPTILRRDKLPEIRRDLGYLEQNRIRVLDLAGNELDPTTVDWAQPGAIMLRQDAGEGNALGEVAIRFPNPFAVYLHDTPSQQLFARQQRTFSSGCVRVDRARELVDMLLEDTGTPARDRVNAIVSSGRTRNVHLARPVPLLVAYLSAGVAPGGHVRLLPDPYRLDQKLARALATAPLAVAGLPCAAR